MWGAIRSRTTAVYWVNDSGRSVASTAANHSAVGGLVQRLAESQPITASCEMRRAWLPCWATQPGLCVAGGFDDGAFVVRAAVSGGHVDAGGPPLGAAPQGGYLSGIEAVSDRLQGHALVA
jgi:hypothetical protein